MFCGFQPMVLKASTTPAAVPELSVLAVFSASMVAVFSASTPRLPLTVTTLSRSEASASIRMRLVAIRPLAATEVAPPPAASPDSVSAPASAPASAAGSAAASSPPSAAPASSDEATTSPLSTAEICAVAEAVIEASPPVVSVRLQASAATVERTSLREKTPPAATAPPDPLLTLADMATSAVMLASSVADTVSPPPTSKVAWAAPSRRFLPSA